MIKGSIFQEDIPIFKPFKSKLNGELDKLLLTVVIGDTNIFLLVTDRSSRQKINKDITDVSCIINHLVQLTFIDCLIQPQQEYAFFSSTRNIHCHRPYSRPQKICTGSRHANISSLDTSHYQKLKTERKLVH